LKENYTGLEKSFSNLSMSSIFQGYTSPCFDRNLQFVTNEIPLCKNIMCKLSAFRVELKAFRLLHGAFQRKTKPFVDTEVFVFDIYHLFFSRDNVNT